MLATELRIRVESALEKRIPRALTPPQRPAPERMLTNLAAVDTLTGGIPLGCLTEICGVASSGRTSIVLSLLAECMRRHEICALVDSCDAFDPQSAANAGIDLGRLLWVRCKESSNRPIRSSAEIKRKVRTLPSGIRPLDLKESSKLEQALKTADLLLQAGGFGMVVLDLGDIPVSEARRIPLTTWFRFRRAVENTSTAFIVVEQYPHAKSCATLVMDLTAQQTSWSEAADQNGTVMPAHLGNPAPLFHITAEGVAIPFEKTTKSSFETPQRWNTSRARLLDTVHVHLQITRSRSLQHIQKFPAQPEVNSKSTKYTKVVSLLN